LKTSLAEWPSVRDVVRELDLSQPYVNRLVRSGALRGIRTRLGWLVDPDSVKTYARQRAERRASIGRVA
jgi:ribosomal protein S13